MAARRRRAPRRRRAGREAALRRPGHAASACACAHDIPFYRAQTRIALRDVGVIDPESLDEYLARGGYEAARKALTTMTPEAIVEEMLASGLRGRGGAGFPTGTKWKFARCLARRASST